MSPREARAAIATEEWRLEAAHGAENAPMGGWRNTAVANVAEALLVNPYALDRLARS